MKVAHLSTYDIRGGAAKAAFRIHQALQLKMESYMLVNTRESDDPFVRTVSSGWQRIMVRALIKIDNQPARKIAKEKRLTFSNGFFSTPGQRDNLQELNADIVNLHWINDGLISIGGIRKIDRPIVWTMHDMWPFTGGCHYTIGCEHYKTHCGKCPQLKSTRTRDLSHYIFDRKEKLKGQINFVAPSLWLKKCLSESALFSASPVHHIPYPIDTERFKPRSRDAVREIFGLPTDKKLILFGAVNGIHDQRKGYSYLLSALDQLAQNTSVADTELVVFGSSAPQDALIKKYRIHYIGKLTDEISLSLLYSAADVFVAPSTEDNLPNTVIESLSCGVPVVAFRIGGMPDMIDHEKNGFLADPLSGESLAEGIRFVLDGDAAGFSENARRKVITHYDPLIVAEQYLKLYQSLKK